jgi:D-glycero-alpha-D-manno-heptose-7-phosphate kinase
MSFAGGGSDMPAYYRHHGAGAVVSTAIDKYVYVTVNKKFDNGIRVAYSKNEEVRTVAEVEHQLVRASLEHAGISGGVEITTIADIPSRGTGLGSSSSFTVGLLHALYAYSGRYASSEQLGADSCYIEMDRCNQPIGKQDQYVAAFGGFNLIRFNPDDTVVVTPIICRRDTVERIKRNILVFYTGIARSASDLLEKQTEAIRSGGDKPAILTRMVGLSLQLADELQRDNAAVFGEILHESWMLKKTILDQISTPEINSLYEMARAAGAIGGKILGAGAGGFLMLYAPRERHEAITRALHMLTRIEVGFEPLGSRIIFYH